MRWRRLIVAGSVALACTSTAPTDDGSLTGSSSGPTPATDAGSSTSTSGSTTTSTSMTTGTSGGSTSGVFKLDVAPPAGTDTDATECFDLMDYYADDGNTCALDTVVYDRQAELLTLTVTKGRLFEITDSAVEVIFATEQIGYEGFFTIAREAAQPDVFYFLVADDDFVQVETECGVEQDSCTPSCNAGAGGDVCRAFVDDFIPIVAAQYVGAAFTQDLFQRRTGGTCCLDIDTPFLCNVSETTYTEYVASGPSGTIHFVFEDAFAFLVHMGWQHVEHESVSGAAEFEFNVCDLPVPEG